MTFLPSPFRLPCATTSQATLPVLEERAAVQLLALAKNATCQKRIAFTKKVRGLAKRVPNSKFAAFGQNPDSAAPFIPFSPTFTCPDEERIGSLLGSGKWVCGVRRLPLSCLVYTFGSLVDLSFEKDLKFHAPNCQVHLFNPRECLETSGKPCGKDVLTFHQMAISSVEGFVSGFLRSFSQIAHSLNHTKVDILMLDIGNADEVDVLRSILASKIPIGQLLVRFSPSKGDYAGGAARFRKLRDLFLTLGRKGFELFHAEPALLSLPVMELSFINEYSLPSWLEPEC